MISKLFLFFIIFSTTLKSLGQINFSKQDSSLLMSQIKIKQKIISANSILVPPIVPKGFKVSLIGSDNLNTINLNGIIYQPIHDLQVSLLYKVIRINDSSFMELPLTVTIKGKYPANEKAKKPFTIPTLREWHSIDGNFSITPHTKIVVSSSSKNELLKAATILQKDLEVRCKILLKVKIGNPDEGDIFLTLNGNKAELGKEGYYLEIKNTVNIVAADYKGIFWATRSILQILEQDKNLVNIPKGICRDYPKYQVRGFMLDVGRKYFSIDFLREYVKLLAYYKISDFQLHLSDNAFVKHYNNNWDSTYSGFRLENNRYPNLATKGEFYTKKEFVELQILAEDYGINLIPEIDIPAHSLAFGKAFPQIASSKYGKDHLDINNKETYSILENIFKEYLEGPDPLFRNKEVHIGTDEYDKTEAEAFRKFTDHFIKYVQSFGKEVRIWGSLTHADGKTPVTNKKVTLNAWYNGYADPIEMKKQGYPMISTPDEFLYIVPAAGYYYDYLELDLLYKKWEPLVVGDKIFNPGDPFIRGGMFCVWNDIPKSGYTAQDVTDRVFPAIQVLSEKMWQGENKTMNYNLFAKNAKNIGEDPQQNLRAKHKDWVWLTSEIKEPKNIKIENKNEINFLQNNSSIILPFEEIGYNYTVNFEIFPSQISENESVVFQSKNAKVFLKNGKFGFSHEANIYSFSESIPIDKWSKISFVGDNNSTTLFLNGIKLQKLTRQKLMLNNGKDVIYKMNTLFFPLRKMGDDNHSFIGKIKNLKVFNSIIEIK